MQFKKAERTEVRLREAILGPSGSGKTYTALDHATRLAAQLGGKIALIDTEHGSASKYADKFDFDVLELTTYSPMNYVEAINAAADAGYRFLVIDSLSHAWSGQGGVLDMVTVAAKKKSGNTYAAWGEVTPEQHRLIESMLEYPYHLIVTMRTKMEYVQEKDQQTGKTVVRKVGMQPIQRDGLEYEFDIVGDLDVDHTLLISKTRCSEIADKTFSRPGDNFARPVIAWIEGAAVDAAKTESDAKAEADRQKLIVKIRAGIDIAAKENIGGLGAKPHLMNWIKKHCVPAQHAGELDKCDAATLQAAIDDLTEKAAADYRKQAEQIEEAYYSTVTGLDDEEIEAEKSRLRLLYLKTPLDPKPTGLIDKASPNTIKKYIEALKKEMAA